MSLTAHHRLIRSGLRSVAKVYGICCILQYRCFIVFLHFLKCSSFQMLKCVIFFFPRCRACAVVQHVWCAAVAQAAGTPLWPGSSMPSSYCCGPSLHASCCHRAWMSSSKGYGRTISTHSNKHRKGSNTMCDEGIWVNNYTDIKVVKCVVTSSHFTASKIYNIHI